MATGHHHHRTPAPTSLTGVIQVASGLWRGGQIRLVGLPDLLVAAVAERERVTVLHYDAYYDQIAKITGQPVRWIVPRGTVP